MPSRPEVDPPRRTQAERRARSRRALLESAARGLSHYGYGSLSLDRVASDAGYTRGALYHLFSGKEELARAVVEWVQETWDAEVGAPAFQVDDPVEALLTLARLHAVYCRRDVAGVLLTLRVEFAAQQHPIGEAITAVLDELASDCAQRIAAARDAGGLPPGPSPQDTAEAYLSALEGVVIPFAGRPPLDVIFAERTARGVLGLPVGPGADVR